VSQLKGEENWFLGKGVECYFLNFHLFTVNSNGNCNRQLSHQRAVKKTIWTIHPQQADQMCTTDAPFRKISNSAQSGRFALIL